MEQLVLESRNEAKKAESLLFIFLRAFLGPHFSFLLLTLLILLLLQVFSFIEQLLDGILLFVDTMLHAAIQSLRLLAHHDLRELCSLLVLIMVKY